MNLLLTEHVCVSHSFSVLFYSACKLLGQIIWFKNSKKLISEFVSKCPRLQREAMRIAKDMDFSGTIGCLTLLNHQEDPLKPSHEKLDKTLES